ncbi:histidinol-phosphate transaminase [Salarchaeum japonicum]|uniref:Histidinol-phosphate aminotransferase n=1 Tax=Salarchaeum japonicum TaxID=555573 RepID=A0AAV3T4B7_9EURY|nr:histidinol-phosphate transaminase [Salarchaeum japonicum]
MHPRDLSDHVEYQAGRGIEEVARELGRDPSEFVKLASNENMFGPSPLGAEAVRETATDVHHYPTADHADLVARIADEWDVTDDQVWLANGGDGALDYLARATLEPGDDVLVPDPGFSYYGMTARFHHGGVSTYPVERDDGFSLTADAVLDAYDGERVVFLTSPHNPSGGRFTLDAVEEIAEETDEETLVVVDEAYGEFTDAPTAIDLVRTRDGVAGSNPAASRAKRDDVVVLRTFSKAYGLAGLRLGYAVVPEAWADAYRRVNTPFAANLVACRAGLAALEDDEHVERTVETAAWAREYMTEHIDARVFESHGNFVLVEVGDAAAVADALKRRGVIVRDCTSFGLDDCIRITCGTKEETETVVAELNEVLAE